MFCYLVLVFKPTRGITVQINFLKGAFPEIFLFLLHLSSNVLSSFERILWNPNEGKKAWHIFALNSEEHEQFGNAAML